MNQPLIIAAILSAIAAGLHVGCVIFGAPWYRFFGAGQKMTALAEAGSLIPGIVTSCIAAGLSLFSAYALSGAGVMDKLPSLRVVLTVITSIYMLRGVAGFFFIFYPLENTPKFWLWSSIICLIFGLFHLIGLYQQWPQL